MDLGLGLIAHMRVVRKERDRCASDIHNGREIVRKIDVNEVVKSKGKMTRTTVILPHNDKQLTVFPESRVSDNPPRIVLHRIDHFAPGLRVLPTPLPSSVSEHGMDELKMYGPRVYDEVCFVEFNHTLGVLESETLARAEAA